MRSKPEGYLTAEGLGERIAQFPRVRLAHLPTPLEPMPRLAGTLGGPDLWVKRDDATGLAFGGNKARQLEFSLAAARAEGADCVVAGASSESNFCRQVSAACAKLGLETHLVLRQVRGEGPPQGNLLLDYLLGAQVELVETVEEQHARLQARRAELRARGRKPFAFGPGDVPLRALGYVDAFLEMLGQFKELGLRPTALVVTSAGATQAGLLVASQSLGRDLPIWSVNHGRPDPDARPKIASAANRTAQLLDLPLRYEPADIPAFNQYCTPPYGPPSEACLEALRLAARAEGLLLDPAYTGKGMAGLIDQVRAGRWGKGDTVVFLHTGGTPALFAYASSLT